MRRTKDLGDIFYVYVIFRLNGVPCYVGKGHKSRWRDHDRHTSNRHLRHIIAQAPEPLPRVKLMENLSEVEAFEQEIALIAMFGREKDGGILCNVTKGGEGWTGEHSVKFKKLASDVKKAAYAADPDLAKRVSEATKNAMQEPELKARMTACRRQWATENPEHYERMRALIPAWTPERRADQIAKTKGVPRPGQAERTREFWTGRKHSEEARAKMREAGRKRGAPSLETRKKLSAAATAQHARTREEKKIG